MLLKKNKNRLLSTASLVTLVTFAPAIVTPNISVKAAPAPTPLTINNGDDVVCSNTQCFVGESPEDVITLVQGGVVFADGAGEASLSINGGAITINGPVSAGADADGFVETVNINGGTVNIDNNVGSDENSINTINVIEGTLNLLTDIGKNPTGAAREGNQLVANEVNVGATDATADANLTLGNEGSSGNTASYGNVNADIKALNLIGGVDNKVAKVKIFGNANIDNINLGAAEFTNSLSIDKTANGEGGSLTIDNADASIVVNKDNILSIDKDVNIEDGANLNLNLGTGVNSVYLGTNGIILSKAAKGLSITADADADLMVDKLTYDIKGGQNITISRSYADEEQATDGGKTIISSIVANSSGAAEENNLNLNLNAGLGDIEFGALVGQPLSFLNGRFSSTGVGKVIINPQVQLSKGQQMTVLGNLTLSNGLDASAGGDIIFDESTELTSINANGEAVDFSLDPQNKNTIYINNAFGGDPTEYITNAAGSITNAATEILL